MPFTIHTINVTKGKNSNTVHIVPKKLNKKCPRAAFLAATLPLSDARIGVIVVPMLLPSTMAHAISNGIQPFVHIIRTIANVAADD